jgi:hypothetical protein
MCAIVLLLVDIIQRSKEDIIYASRISAPDIAGAEAMFTSEGFP